MNYIKIKNGSAFPLQALPMLSYDEFSREAGALMGEENVHCASYFATWLDENCILLLMVLADDKNQDLILLSSKVDDAFPAELRSLTPEVPALHLFEREIMEEYPLVFTGHPWAKPVRYPFNRQNAGDTIYAYPFYNIDSEQLHLVGVGPVHAGIIEPGHFRFICDGEKVLHLEIQLGWQHRGVEHLMLTRDNVLKRTLLSENIAGDSVIEHGTAWAMVAEALSGKEISDQLAMERAIAQELERMAIHTGDIAALCTDVAYHLGANVFGILRTGLINFTQAWCGNRLGKSLVRPGGTHYRLTKDLRERLRDVLNDFERRFIPMSHLAYKVPSVQNRFDNIGVVTSAQAKELGLVGMAARMAGLARDTRAMQPYAGYINSRPESIVLPKGDVFARFLLRRKEIKASLAWIRQVLDTFPFDDSLEESPDYKALELRPGYVAVALTEGWRGEVCHVAITSDDRNLLRYKIKDPSFHNWKALELSLRNLEISDFPINNKSYNLSYCGFDL